MIPNFNTSSSLFAQHFSILRELKKKVNEFKKRIKDKMNKGRLTRNVEEKFDHLDQAWSNVKMVEEILDSAIDFLNFPVQD